MQFSVSTLTNIKEKRLRKKIYHLNKLLLKQKEKVSYAYKNLKTNDICSFNPDICFYSASAIKFLVCLYLYEQAENNPNLLETKIKLLPEDFMGGSGILKNNPNKDEYTIRELVYYTLKDSDNTAYIKLVSFVTKEKLKEYGASLEAQHTLEGKDSFGIINANDMIVYLTHLYDYFNTDTDLSRELKNDMIAPTYQIIKPNSIGNNIFVRKYGSFGIAYHEVGIVYDENPYVLIVLTQKNELEEKQKVKYINKVAKKIHGIHS